MIAHWLVANLPGGDKLPRVFYSTSVCTHSFQGMGKTIAPREQERIRNN